MLFIDLRGSTSLAESLSPSDYSKLHQKLWAEAFPIIKRAGGDVDKVMGDGLLCLFPLGNPRIFEAAFQIRDLVEQGDFSKGLTDKFMTCGMGVATGEIILSVVGSDEKIQVEPHGRVLNLAARLQALTKELKANLLICPQTFASIGQDTCSRYVGRRKIDGIQNEIPVFEILNERSVNEIDRTKCSTAAIVSEAIRLFEIGDYGRSFHAFSALPEALKSDVVVSTYIAALKAKEDLDELAIEYPRKK